MVLLAVGEPAATGRRVRFDLSRAVDSSRRGLRARRRPTGLATGRPHTAEQAQIQSSAPLSVAIAAPP